MSKQKNNYWFSALFIIVALINLIIPYQAIYAITFSFDDNNDIAEATGLGDQDPIIIAGYIINWVLSILGLLALILVIYAGFRWMLARGNEEEITKAKEILSGAVIGLAIILGSYGISQYVFTKLVSITIT